MAGNSYTNNGYKATNRCVWYGTMRTLFCWLLYSTAQGTTNNSVNHLTKEFGIEESKIGSHKSPKSTKKSQNLNRFIKMSFAMAWQTHHRIKLFSFFLLTYTNVSTSAFVVIHKCIEKTQTNRKST